MWLPNVDGDVIARKMWPKSNPPLLAWKLFRSENWAADGILIGKNWGHRICRRSKRKLLNQTLAPFLRSEILQAIEVAKKQATISGCIYSSII